MASPFFESYKIEVMKSQSQPQQTGYSCSSDRDFYYSIDTSSQGYAKFVENYQIKLSEFTMLLTFAILGMFISYQAEMTTFIECFMGRFYDRNSYGENRESYATNFSLATQMLIWTNNLSLMLMLLQFGLTGIGAGGQFQIPLMI